MDSKKMSIQAISQDLTVRGEEIVHLLSKMDERSLQEVTKTCEAFQAYRQIKMEQMGGLREENGVLQLRVSEEQRKEAEVRAQYETQIRALQADIDALVLQNASLRQEKTSANQKQQVRIDSLIAAKARVVQEESSKTQASLQPIQSEIAKVTASIAKKRSDVAAAKTNLASTQDALSANRMKLERMKQKLMELGPEIEEKFRILGEIDPETWDYDDHKNSQGMRAVLFRHALS
jgi:chromosome segregation ATPase